MEATIESDFDRDPTEIRPRFDRTPILAKSWPSSDRIMIEIRSNDGDAEQIARGEEHCVISVT